MPILQSLLANKRRKKKKKKKKKKNGHVVQNQNRLKVKIYFLTVRSAFYFICSLLDGQNVP